ncbi:uncharacterized protein UBRO2_04454 [Ustilago bromivora]|uniref:Uncharacterized protein n=1 Tax=Ustilago bromivora TaxID=307758 RepID=A0A8H8TTU4_9BASI|nr:uncharacterized protein UBRO2_04454 [Ustilago bromivora]
MKFQASFVTLLVIVSAAISVADAKAPNMAKRPSSLNRRDEQAVLQKRGFGFANRFWRRDGAYDPTDNKDADGTSGGGDITKPSGDGSSEATQPKDYSYSDGKDADGTSGGGDITKPSGDGSSEATQPQDYSYSDGKDANKAKPEGYGGVGGTGADGTEDLDQQPSGYAPNGSDALDQNRQKEQERQQKEQERQQKEQERQQKEQQRQQEEEQKRQQKEQERQQKEQQKQQEQQKKQKQQQNGGQSNPDQSGKSSFPGQNGVKGPDQAPDNCPKFPLQAGGDAAQAPCFAKDADRKQICSALKQFGVDTKAVHCTDDECSEDSKDFSNHACNQKGQCDFGWDNSCTFYQNMGFSNLHKFGCDANPAGSNTPGSNGQQGGDQTYPGKGEKGGENSPEGDGVSGDDDECEEDNNGENGAGDQPQPDCEKDKPAVGDNKGEDSQPYGKNADTDSQEPKGYSPNDSRRRR